MTRKNSVSTLDRSISLPNVLSQNNLRGESLMRAERSGLNRVQSCRVGLDPPIREAIAVSRDSGLRVNDTPPVILSEAEESLQ